MMPYVQGEYFAMREFVGIDVSKNKLDVCWLRDVSDRKIKEKKLTNNADGFRALAQWLLKTIKKVQIADLHLDPHPKNFVLASEKITYVDFTPPYGKDYFSLRLSVADDSENEILNNFFHTLNKESLGYHLAGDIMKIDSNNHHHLPLLYKKMTKLKIIQSDYDYFVKRLNEIITIEKGRELGNIFLI